MLDSEPTGAAEGTGQEHNDTATPPVKTTRRRRTTKAAAAPEAPAPEAQTTPDSEPEKPPAAKRTRARKATAKAAAPKATKAAAASGKASESAAPAASDAPAAETEAPAKPKRARAAAPPTVTFIAPPEPPPVLPARAAAAETAPESGSDGASKPESGTDAGARAGTKAAPAKQARKRAAKAAPKAAAPEPPTPEVENDADRDEDGDGTSRRRRRGRRGRGRGRADGDGEAGTEQDASDEESESTETPDDQAAEDSGEGTTRRRRRRRRSGDDGDQAEGSEKADRSDRSEKSAGSSNEVRAIKGSTRLEAKRQRRRDGREQTRRRPPILSESEFLARRESVERSMVVRQRGDRTQIAVMEDEVLVEHYVTKATSTSYAGNVYLGRVQNVLPSMEAAFVDIGKGRNAVLYAGEVNWDLAGLDGKARNIEQALRSGDSVLVQVSKDPIGHKGARLTSQISLPGRYLVYVPGGAMTGISRKLPDVERTRLKAILRKIVPDDAGVIIRTAAEGASEEELTRDVNRLKAQWEVIEARSQKEKSAAPTLLYEEPDLAIRVVRDIFNEDFAQLVISGDEVWETLQQYVEHVAPDLKERLHHHTGESDVFAELQVDEQLAKGLDRKVWLPSGGSLVIDRTEAMTVVDVNTGKFTGQGGNLEETVTRNNLEAAEEIVRQLRLRDIGGIIVIDFIDMVLESNRDLVLRRLTECLGRDRTRHQVAEVTSLGLVQMTRKRVGQGLLEAFSEPCPHCNGRGLIVHTEPVEIKQQQRNGSDNGNGKSKSKSKGEPKGESRGEDGDRAKDADKRRDVAAARRNRSAKATAAVESETDGAPAPDDAAPAPVAAVPATPVPAPAAEVATPETEPSPEPVSEPSDNDSPAPVAVAAAPVTVVGEAAATNGVARPRRGRRRAAVREAGPPAS